MGEKQKNPTHMPHIHFVFVTLANRNSSSYCVAHAHGSQTLLCTWLRVVGSNSREKIYKFKKELSALKSLFWVKFSFETFSIIP